VDIMIGQGSGYSVQVIDSGGADIAISDAPVPIKMRNDGAKVKIIGIIFDKHPNCMFFWKSSGITKPQDIVGKTVAVPATDGHKLMWPTFAKGIGVDPESVRFINIDAAAKASSLASKRADVVFELFTMESVMAKAIPPGELGYFLWADYGFNPYAHSLITSDEIIKTRPEMLRKFLRATYRAWQYALLHPEEAIDILVEYQPVNRDDMLANLKTEMEFFRTDRYKNNGIGYIDPARMRETYNTLENPKFPVEDCYDPSFLPNPPFKYDF
ncbi:MAG: ABC transporter substrate-binding protein, partial [Planctomycetota bacterium]|jgi:NitT/TauT family transport system substrate-binding protein|nr:ABC transporter substrate-binding protein [Planctomycetota bacterium]